jgi:hypothetical protein
MPPCSTFLLIMSRGGATRCDEESPNRNENPTLEKTMKTLLIVIMLVSPAYAGHSNHGHTSNHHPHATASNHGHK